MTTIKYTNSSGSSSSFANWNVDTTSNLNTTNIRFTPSIAPSGGCNESKVHNNEEKALYHGLKSAYRMSREFDGEYGTADPPYETAARIAAEVANAFFATTDHEYTREASFEYLEDQFLNDPWYESLLDWFRSDATDEPAFGIDEFEAAIDKSWTQIDDKRKHYDAARTALATAEAFLRETLH